MWGGKTEGGTGLDVTLPPVLLRTTIARLEESGVGHLGLPRSWLIAAYSTDVKAKTNGMRTALWRDMKRCARKLSDGCWYGRSGSIDLSLSAASASVSASAAAEASEGTRE